MGVSYDEGEQAAEASDGGAAAGTASDEVRPMQNTTSQGPRIGILKASLINSLVSRGLGSPQAQEEEAYVRKELHTMGCPQFDVEAHVADAKQRAAVWLCARIGRP